MTERAPELRNDLIVARYEADRAHELAVDVATAQYELALIQSLAVLHAGSATAFITLIGSGFPTVIKVAPITSSIAVTSWVLGLLTSVFAGYRAYQAQTRFVSSLRAGRKYAVLRLFGQNEPALFDLKPEETEGALYTEWQRRASMAESSWRLANFVSLAALALFVAGVVFAGYAVWSGVSST